MLSDNLFKEKFGTFNRTNPDNQDFTKFIHASDIHLGSHQYQNFYRSNDFIRAFKEILELAIEYQVDFIILGGDVFTSLEMLPGKLTEIIDLLKNFKDFSYNSISIITIEGNHDIRKFSRGVRFERRGQSWLKLLNSLGLIILLDADLSAPPEHLFQKYDFGTKKGGKIQIKNVVIYGTQYLGEKPLAYLSKIRKGIVKDKELFNILLQHFGIEGQMENIPGVKIEEIQPLRHRINYLALGHFHKQFTLEDWIYNPGSSEAVCSMDTSFQRGTFLVEVSKKFENFEKKVINLCLVNRKYLWDTIYLNDDFRNKKEIVAFIINKLGSSLKYLNSNIHASNPKMPVLYLILKGVKPSKLSKFNEKELKKKISDTYPVVDVKIYQKFNKSLKTLDNYILS
ncbi:MAG: DNA repair exonuclease [Promethearchaeota archaeon]|nr:MAG: DNA repair exonuclease [Candidatus Lokiarchaeota archaeon]